MLSVEVNTCRLNMEIIMKHLNKQLTAILSILIFSIGVMLSCNSFAAGGKKATQAALDAEIIDRTEAFNILQNQINNIHIQIDSLQINSVTYEIGDIGPAGGIVFYVTDGGLHGLEAAPKDQDSGYGAQWGCEGTSTGANGTAVGTGSQNTAVILRWCATDGIAAKLADDYELNGYTDWFLPSKDELEMFLFYGSVVPGLHFTEYWSSTESDNEKAWQQEMRSGSQYPWPKEWDLNYVRAIRAF